MKRMNNIEIAMAAEKKFTATMCHVGIANAKKIMYRAWKLAQAEEKRQKQKNRVGG